MYSKSCFWSAGEVDWKDAAAPGGGGTITRNKSLSQMYGRRTMNRTINITSIEEDSFGTCWSKFDILSEAGLTKKPSPHGKYLLVDITKTFKRTQYNDTDEGWNNILRHYISQSHRKFDPSYLKNTISYLLLHHNCQRINVRHEISHRIQVRYVLKKAMKSVAVECTWHRHDLYGFFYVVPHR
jgi:hypothetical protein